MASSARDRATTAPSDMLGDSVGRKRIELTVTPAAKLTRGQRSALGAEAERIGAFLALEPALAYA